MTPSPARGFNALFTLLLGVAIGIGAGAPILISLFNTLTTLANRSDGWVPRILGFIQQTGIFG